MTNFTHLKTKWNKLTHIFITSTNSPTTHLFSPTSEGVFGDVTQLKRLRLISEEVATTRPEINTKAHWLSEVKNRCWVDFFGNHVFIGLLTCLPIENDKIGRIDLA